MSIIEFLDWFLNNDISVTFVKHDTSINKEQISIKPHNNCNISIPKNETNFIGETYLVCLEKAKIWVENYL